MSLEDMYKKGVRRVKKRDAKLAQEGTTAGKEVVKRQQRLEAASSLSRAQQQAATTDSAKNGYQPDNEGIICRTCGNFYTGSMSSHWESH
jgi:hypothetical protein